MPWNTTNIMEQRLHFITLAQRKIHNFTQLCKLFNISRTTGYKWVQRSNKCSLITAVHDRPKRPKSSPRKISQDIEDAIISLRLQHSRWGARKLGILLKEQFPRVPIPSERTINRIIVRNNLLNDDSPQGTEPLRFEASAPNDLWQMDYKGEFAFGIAKIRCYPFDILDDHSRFNITLDAHGAIHWEDTQQSLTNAFQNYGLPNKILVDRGSCWYTAHSLFQPWTRLVVWLMRLGIELIYARAYHPQTIGKIERFHRTLKYDCIKKTEFESFTHIKQVFEDFQHEYNNIRPHDAIGLQRPVERYYKSQRSLPQKLPPVEYSNNAIVRMVDRKGRISFKKHKWPVSKALIHLPVKLKQVDIDKYNVFFIKTHIRTLNLKTPDKC